MGFDDDVDWQRLLASHRPLRRYPRLKVNLPAEYQAGPVAKSAEILSLGGGGLFLGVGEAFSPGTELSVNFRLARQLPPLETRARVVYHVPAGGIGIEFVEISPGHRQMILRFIHKKMAENRKFPRAPLAVQVEQAGGVAIGFSRDISMGGMFIETDEKFDTNSSVQLRFHVDESGQIVVATAEIRYVVHKLGMGVQFSQISPQDRDRIESYIKKETRRIPPA